ncbi:MAG: hypothetical protein D3923_18005, partial [Candidatus Electrothrix sp. AR3]|nr:hypothetical protein [Candidatus Electrothrix sp. AR3]
MTSSTQPIRVKLPNGAVVLVEATPIGSREADVAGGGILEKKFPLSDISKSLEGIVSVVNDAIIKQKPN